MASVFDFQKLRNLVQTHGLTEIVIMDTNVVMENPRFEDWRTSARKPVFLITNLTYDELLRVVDKQDKPLQDGSRKAKAKDALAALDSLLDKGKVSEGFNVKGVGWFISYLNPSRKALAPELSALDALVNTHGHGPNDAVLLLLTMHCSEEFQGLPVVLVTGDGYLHSCCRNTDVSSYHCSQLPNEGFNDWLSNHKFPNIDWDVVRVRELESMNQQAKEHSVEVSLTLTSKRLVHNWPREVFDWETGDEESSWVSYADVIFAEGHGEIALPNGVVSFLWRVSYTLHEWDSCLATTPLVEKNDVDMDFVGRQGEVSEEIRRGIIEVLRACANHLGDPSFEVGLPSLQTPKIDILQVMAATNMPFPLFQDDPTMSGVDEKANLKDRLIDRLSSIKTDEDLWSFFDYQEEPWEIGETVHTRVSTESDESTQD